MECKPCDGEATLERLDAARRLYAKLFALCAQREELLAKEAAHFVLPAGAEPAVATAGGAVPLRDALKRDPSYSVVGSLLAPPAGTATLSDDKEEAFAKLAALDEAIGILEALEASPAQPALGGGSSSGEFLPPHGRAARSEAASAGLPGLAAADAELRHGLGLATPAVRRALAVAEGGGGGGEGGGEGGGPLLPAGTTVHRPFISAETRKRLRTWAHAAEGSTSEFQLPCAALGGLPSLRLQKGDVLHVPFTGAEASILRRVVDVYDGNSAADGEEARRNASDGALAAACERLPGRTALDCRRFLESAAAAPERALPERAGGGKASSAKAMSPGKATLSPAKAASPAKKAAKGGPSDAASSSERMWQVSATYVPPREKAANEALGKTDGKRREARENKVIDYSGKVGPAFASAASASVAAASGGGSRVMGGGGSGWRPLGAQAAPLLGVVGWRQGGGAGANGLGGHLAYHTMAWRALYRGYTPTSVSTKATGNVTDMQFRPNSRFPRLAVGSTAAPHEALFYDLSTARSHVLGAGAPPGSNPPWQHDCTVSRVQFSAHGSRLLTAAYDQTVRVWTGDTGQLERVLGVPVAPPPPPELGVPEAGGAAADGAAGGEAEADPPLPEGQLEPGQAAAANLPEGQLEPEDFFAGGGADDVAEAPLGPWAYGGSVPGHSDHVLCLAAHPERDELAASGGKDSTVVLWDIARGEALRRLSPPSDPLDLIFGSGSSEGVLAAAIDRPKHGQGGGRVMVWDVETGSVEWTIPQHRGHISCLNASKSGDTLLVGAADGTMRMLSARDGRVIFNFQTGMSDVNLVSLSCGETYVQASGDANLCYVLDIRRPDRPLHILRHAKVSYVNGVSAAWCHRSHSTLVTGSDDTLVRIWDVALAQPEVARLQGHASPVSCVAVSPEDELVASGGDEGKVVLYTRRTDAAGAWYRVGAEQDNMLRKSQQELCLADEDDEEGAVSRGRE